MLRKRLVVQLSESYESVMKLLLLAKQGRLTLKEASLKANEGVIIADLVFEGPPEKIQWFMLKTSGSPYVLECKKIE
ncbi:MAG: hypothetical protein QXX80_02925 [Nitrososphaerota archaeon]